MSDILEFIGPYRWLSNFWPSDVVYDGVTYPSVENAYQAAKTDCSNREQFVNCSAKEAKKLGRMVIIRSDWEDVKIKVMERLIARKFAPGTELAKLLIETGDSELVEGNWWGDVFWGRCNGRGKNMLGQLLMNQRAFLKIDYMGEML